jgi:hypothetical protein
VRDPAVTQPAEVQKSRLPRVVRLVWMLHAPSRVGSTCESWRGGGDGGDSSMDRRGGAVLRTVRVRDQHRGASVEGTTRGSGTSALTSPSGSPPSQPWTRRRKSGSRSSEVEDR